MPETLAEETERLEVEWHVLDETPPHPDKKHDMAVIHERLCELSDLSLPEPK